MADMQIRDHLDTDYSDVYTPEVLTALNSLAELNVERLDVMRKRMERRTERGEKQQPLTFLNPEENIGRTEIKVQDARDGKFVGPEIPADLQRQWIQVPGQGLNPTRPSIAVSAT